jgi:hypothetical protein
MTDAELRALALALPEAVEKPHMARTSFRVRERIFATISEDRTQAMVFVDDARRRYGLIEEQPESFVSLGGWTRMGALGVVLAKVDRELLRELLVASWRRIAPKRALTAYDGPAAPAAKRRKGLNASAAKRRKGLDAPAAKRRKPR